MSKRLHDVISYNQRSYLYLGTHQIGDDVSTRSGLYYDTTEALKPRIYVQISYLDIHFDVNADFLDRYGVETAQREGLRRFLEYIAFDRSEAYAKHTLTLFLACQTDRRAA